MVRQLLLSIVLMLAAWPVAVHADVTATYDVGRGTMTMVVEAADNGAARGSHTASMPGAPELLYFLTPEGGHYFAWQTDGAWFVAGFEDVLAVMREGVATRMPEQYPSRSNPWPKSSFIEQGVETLAGRTGKRFVSRKEDGSLSLVFDLVISADADLAPIGRVLAKSWLFSLAGMAPLIGGMPPEFTQMGELLAQGTMIRMGRMAALKSVEVGPIDPARFALPAAPASRDEVRRAMTHGRPAPAPAPAAKSED